MKQGILVMLVMSFISIFVGTSMIFIMSFLGLLTFTTLAESKSFELLFKSKRSEQIKEELPTFDYSKELMQEDKTPVIKNLPIEIPKDEAPAPIIRPQPIEQPKPVVVSPVKEETKKKPEVKREIRPRPVRKKIVPKDNEARWDSGNPVWRQHAPNNVYLEDYDSTKIKRKYRRR